jgi:hypothetical protein
VRAAQEAGWRREAEARWRQEWGEAKRDEQAQYATEALLDGSKAPEENLYTLTPKPSPDVP